LDEFFSVTLQERIREDWREIYTIFSGGDDLLLVGPWDVMLHFAQEVQRLFSEGVGRTYDRKISAAVAFMPPGIPIRHGVSKAEELLAKAKSGDKNQCASLGGVWTWPAQRKITGLGRQLVKWVDCGAGTRGLVRRLYELAGKDVARKAHLWAWELGRNFPGKYEKREEHRLFREWGDKVLANWGKREMEETRAALQYALIATRKRSAE
jgi:CRISPR-associated protein Csm1